MSEPPRTDVFISYSRKDSRWLDQLMTHLKLLIREERVVAWCDRDIPAGKRWREEIDRALASARVGLLLVSPNFLASDFIMRDELPYLLQAADTRGVKLLWVLVSVCLFDQTPIVELQAAYNPARPRAKLQGNQRDEALTAIAREILKAVGEPEGAEDLPHEPDSRSHDVGRSRRVGGLRDGDDFRDDFLARVARQRLARQIRPTLGHPDRKGDPRLRGHQGSVTSVAFSPQGDKLASASADGTIRIWSVETGQWLVALLPLPEEGWAAVLPDGRYKLVGDPAGRFWHVANLCRFEPGELAPYVESCRPLPLDAVIL